ncbi:MAG: alpha/beta hydrolase [Gammaproteobacteria bacterium]|nr:alpha/beta hydrolase [Gammaproteobacteria bacterium]NIR85737.1 alpha/beta hydrolase [Gammaproteobacteria bacterium]NIR90270.1 alpha/beta hydrolase [Gammaproteobacteria bacterium]NIU06871.1 alpha/beta hydrolase [Gammaproteobacteria bacterium]NIV53804.1 alpha/beta hydrolase [Gammaproteobacteria bacterium]
MGKKYDGTAQALLLVAALALSGCATGGPYQINLMPAPDVYGEDALDPFADADLVEEPDAGVLYATLREPATEGEREHYYRNARGQVLRLGVADIELGAGDITWEEARRISLLKNRTEDYPLRVASVQEFGILDRTITAFTDPVLVPEDLRGPARRFAEAVNKELRRSKRKDVYVYVHGYKVVFENPILVAAELWHFLGYQGAFVAFSWPATPSRWAYVGDTDTAAWSARGFRYFLQYLAEETEVERIHIVGYSAGTRMVSRTLEQLALLHHEKTEDEIRGNVRIGHVMLVGSDVDRQLFGGYILDGLLRVPEHLTIYISEKDKALGFARWLHGRERLGQTWAQGTLSPAAIDFLYRADRLALVNVTEAEGAASGNGHAYFRSSPWASSDILVALMHDLSPAQRGLVRSEDAPTWTFPADYIERLRAAIAEVDPGLGPPQPQFKSSSL